MMSLQNPAGFWALLGIPAILAIHFLQRQSRRVPISTLFLLDQLERENLSGHRVERLKSSIPLWLQLAMVLGLTWLLVDPQWLEMAPVQRVVVVMDGSASMLASQPSVTKGLPQELRRLQALAKTTEFIVLDSRLREEQVYRGTTLAELEKALQAWKPGGGAHDNGPALRLGRSLADRKGLLIFVTDKPDGELPLEAKRLSFGEPLANVGFAGLTTFEKEGQALWEAVVKNHGATPESRSWWSEGENGSKTAPQQITLAPNQNLTLQGLLPPRGEPFTLKLSNDEFPLDDTLPALREQPKEVLLELPAGDEAEVAFYKKLFLGLPNVRLAGDLETPHVPILRGEVRPTPLPTGPAIILTKEDREKANMLTAEILTEKHPMVDGLNFQGLMATDTPTFTVKQSDEVLIWQGERALVYLRGTGANEKLLLNFDLIRSNARKLPAVVVLLHRYLQRVRLALPMREWANVDCGQALPVAISTEKDAPPVVLAIPGQADRVLTPDALRTLRAPDEPSLLTVRQGEKEWLMAACRFADVREANLAKNGPSNELANAQAATVQQLNREDRYWRLWMLGILGVALGSWGYLGRRNS
jgi:hypothetical protein